MAIEVNQGFQNNSPTSLDAKYTKFVSGATVPYSSPSEANSIVSPFYRSLGLTLLIMKNGIPTEYWYNPGVADNQLVEKVSTTSSGTIDYSDITNTPDVSVFALKTTTINNYPLSSDITITKADIGIPLVDNTPDLNKPISNATQAALNTKQSVSQKGQANGYAPLGANSLVPSTNLPSYIDQIVEYASYSAFPSTGTAGTIYLDKSTGVQYRWSGTQYTNITSGAVQTVNGMTGNVVIPITADAWKVYGTQPFGKYTNGQTVPSAVSVYAQIKEAYYNPNAPTYTQPVATEAVTAKINGTQTTVPLTSIEVGQVIDFTIDPNYVLWDSQGLASSNPLVITKTVFGNSPVQIGTTDPTVDGAYTTTPTQVIYTSTYSFQGAATKNNDAGDPDTRGIFGPLTKSASVNVTPRYKIFYGTLDSGVSLTSDMIRGNSSSSTVLFKWENDTINSANPIALQTGTTRRKFFVARRAALSRTLISAVDANTNSDVKPQYLQGETTIIIKDGGTGDVTYLISIYEQAVPYGVSHTHNIVL